MQGITPRQPWDGQTNIVRRPKELKKCGAIAIFMLLFYACLSLGTRRIYSKTTK